ncbi:hypothetical protein MtrunA17_Chr1g0202941 [Medicago truncatula]|uniref:Transmembrane protein n=1 Tax=Medicago truncatula TaxID=3880 RepID=A0A396JTZ0_MEDTR|nr:hypothetical protein MtrunA17_Chr1g0202941 [Medicago truncatula]
MFNGRPEELNSDANFLTDSNELRSNSMTSTLAEGISLSIASLISLAATLFRTAIITWTPRKARTRVVSTPIPLVAPTGDNSSESRCINSMSNFFSS